MTVRLFVSYRRDDSKHAAGRLGERLDERFTLFMDVNQIHGGTDFTAAVRAAVDQTDVLLAVIGSQWLTLPAENGGRRIDQPGDWVAEEIGTALARGTPVIPVLVDGAHMPTRDELPPALADLANRQAMRIAHESFAADSTRLIETIEDMVSAAKREHVNLWEDPDYPQARGAFLRGLWPAAIEGFERVLHRHPWQPRVLELLELAQRSQRLLELHATAEGAARDGHWEEAVDALEAIIALQPSDEVSDRLAQAQLRLRISELQNDIRALAETGDWPAVLVAEAELARLDPQAADPDGLATKASAELLETKIAAGHSPRGKELEDSDSTGAEPPSSASAQYRVTPAPAVPDGQPDVPSKEVAPARERRFRRLVLLFLAGLGLAIVPAWVFGFQDFDLPHGGRPSPSASVETVEVPDVTTRSEQQARDQLTARHLTVKVEKTNGDEQTKGTITAQFPVGGSRAEVQSIVTITLNEGPKTNGGAKKNEAPKTNGGAKPNDAPKTGTIPDRLIGRDVKDVRSALKDLHFTNVKRLAATSENPDTQPGEVVSISPKEGSTVPLDAKITVRYATGKSEVPNFEGLSRGAAIREARDAGFGEPQFVERESSKPAGTVIDQSPQAGATVDRDTRIELTLATAPPPSPPPTTEQPTEPPTSPTPTTPTTPTTSEPTTPEPSTEATSLGE